MCGESPHSLTSDPTLYAEGRVHTLLGVGAFSGASQALEGKRSCSQCRQIPSSLFIYIDPSPHTEQISRKLLRQSMDENTRHQPFLSAYLESFKNAHYRREFVFPVHWEGPFLMSFVQECSLKIN